MAEGGMAVMEGPYKPVHDFYVHRFLDKAKNAWLYSVDVNPTPDGPSRTPVPYFGSEGVSEYNASNVRIPALLYIGPKVIIQTFFVRDYVHQIGCHVIVRHNKLYSCEVVLKKYESPTTPRYWMRTYINIACVYPILQNQKIGGKLCLGLHFKCSITGGNREFIGKAIANCNQRGVDEITEDYFDGFHNNPRAPESVCGLLSPRCQQTGANSCPYHLIYVCAGARLIVHDYSAVPVGSGEKEVVTTSLFQQGSFVIMEGMLTIGLNVGYRTPNGEFRPNFIQSITDLKNDDNPSIIPDDLKIKMRLFTTRCALFLGSTDSQCNTVCWQLYVRHKSKDPTLLYCNLYAPECGRLVDVKSYQWGFEEVYYRHRYEQLYNAVLSPVTPKYGYLVPDVSTRNEILGAGPHPRQYFLRTELYLNSDLPLFATGMAGTGTPWAHYVSYGERHSPLMVDKERVVVRHYAARPLVISLNPPIIGDEETPQHISPFVSIQKEPESQIYVISNRRYVLHFGSMPEYEWEYLMNLYELEQLVAQFGKPEWDGSKMRVGQDYRVYQMVERQPPIVGEMEGFYFVRVPD